MIFKTNYLNPNNQNEIINPLPKNLESILDIEKKYWVNKQKKGQYDPLPNYTDNNFNNIAVLDKKEAANDLGGAKW